MTLKLTSAQLERTCGAVLGTAVGDALGAPYEFGSAALGPEGPRMIGGGLGHFAPGEWTDDTTMAWAILDVAATGADLRSPDGLTAIARNFRAWNDSGPADIGNQTRQVLQAVGPEPTGATMTAAAERLHARTGRTAGNGSLMRTAPVALPYLTDATALVEAARAVGGLTHADPYAQDACVLWSLAIRPAILYAEFDVRAGLAYFDHHAAAYWTQRLNEAEQSDPGRFRPNGWAVTALQAAWAAIVHTPVPEPYACAHLSDALTTAIGIGDDTDTVAAIAGGLLGARWGASSIPAEWRRISHGYPGLTGQRLVELAHLAVSGGRPGAYGWPTADHIDYSGHGVPKTLVRHPLDDGVWLADASALDDVPAEVTAVVSLCLVGRQQIRPGLVHIGYGLIDKADPEVNPNLDFLLTDAARTIAALRDEGHCVLVHCVAGQSRTPTVAIAYAMYRGIERDVAYRSVYAALPAATPNPGFRAALERLGHDAAFAGKAPLHRS